MPRTTRPKVASKVPEPQLAFLFPVTGVQEYAEVIVGSNGQLDNDSNDLLSSSFKRFRSIFPKVQYPPIHDHSYAFPMTRSAMRAKLLKLMTINASLRKKLYVM